MSSPTNRGDFGIIFQGRTGTLSTYVDVFGQTRAEVALPSMTDVRMPTTYESAYPHCGLAGTASLIVNVECDASDIALTLQGHEELDPTASWSVLQTGDNETGTTAKTHTFSASGKYILQTPNTISLAELCVLIQPGDDFEGSISVNLQVL